MPFLLSIARTAGPIRHRRLLLAPLVVLLLASAAGESPGAPPERPNVLFFLSDDHRHDQLGCAGHAFLQTPHIDRLAAEGVRFENAFVTTSICAASRASILTGCYERRHGYTFGKPPIPADLVAASYPVVMRAAGYRTGFIGKWGVSAKGKKPREIFDVFKPMNRSPYLKKQPDGTLRHETEIDGDLAVQFLRECKPGKPFCLSVSFNSAHAEDGDKVNHFPWPKAVDGLYDDQPMPAPRLSEPEIFDRHPEFLKQSLNRVRYFWRWDTPEKYQRNLRAYYRMLTGMDRVIGRVVAELDELGLADNTVVIFTGDNGYYMGQRGFAGKWSHYEESLRVPLIVFDPRAEKKQRGRVVSQMALNVDIAPTLLELAGVALPAEYQGRSLMPLVRRESPADWRTDTFCEHLMGIKQIPSWEGVRGPRYVYARYFGQKPLFEFLHDLREDPDQLTNLAGDPAADEVLQRMRRRCDRLREDLSGPVTSKDE